MADASYQPGVYREQGGNRMVVKSGASLDVESSGEIDIESGGSFKLAGTALTSTAAELNILDGVTATAAELNVSDGTPASVSFAYAAGAANVSEVTITVLDAAGVAIASPFIFDVWLSDAATGAGLTGTTTSGTVTAKSASGVVIDTYTAKKALRVQALATGIFILEITDTAKTAFYPCATSPNTGIVQVGAVMASGDYGA